MPDRLRSGAAKARTAAKEPNPCRHRLASVHAVVESPGVAACLESPNSPSPFQTAHQWSALRPTPEKRPLLRRPYFAFASRRYSDQSFVHLSPRSLDEWKHPGGADQARDTAKAAKPRHEP